MRLGKHRLPFFWTTIIGLIAVFLVICYFETEFFVNFWWYNSLGYELYFWQRLLYRYLIFSGVSLLFFSIFFLNFWVASRHLGTSAPPPSSLKPTSLQAYKDLYKMFRTGSMWVYTPLSAVLTIPIALPLFREWEQFLFFVASKPSGVADPVFGKDISFYLFSLPIYTLLVSRLLIAFILLLAGIGFLYWLENRLLSQQDQGLPRGARWHLNILLGFNFLIGIWGLFLQIYMLLYSTAHQPLFFGPGFVQMRVLMPLIWALIVLLAVIAVLLILAVNYKKGIKSLAAFSVLLLLGLGARYTSYLPTVVEKYIVKPNEISKERPFISYNIQSTLQAYRLTHVETRNMTPEHIAPDISAPNVASTLRNIPVWDGELLDSVYQQLQQLRTYYAFPGVFVDRYTVSNTYQQVFLGARELAYDQLSSGARNWINDHLTYTHGYGVVMTPAAQGGNEPMTWFIRGIPPISDYGFSIEQPGIYFGLGNYDYVIAPNNAGEIDYPAGNANVYTNYDGKGGVPISSLFKQLIFSFYFKEKNIFFTTKINDKSKILIHRNILDRIHTLTPFLILDRAPYMVVTKKRLFWIQDAYVATNWYPYSAPYTSREGSLNYIRNSVKIVIDAYNGSVDYYIYDPEDPIIMAYNRIYPGLFKPADQMPHDIALHVRYPQDFFDIQMAIYAKYHQTDEEVYYQQEDIWQVPEAFTYGTGQEALRAKPYYLTLDLIKPGQLDFLLMLPMIPKGRQNLRALPIVGCDGLNYGKIIVYNFPKGELVYGPSQINALIDQDTKIAEQFTLWNQIGSELGRGKMIILPVGKVMLYIQPVYLKSSTHVKIPQLQRLIMSEGQNVVMEENLEQDYRALEAKMKVDQQRIEQRYGPPQPETPPPPGEGAVPGEAPEPAPLPAPESPSPKPSP
jgi:uncharacterized membrane protein (UPF0182 family)